MSPSIQIVQEGTRVQRSLLPSQPSEPRSSVPDSDLLQTIN
ncbi:hypothetical protein [Trichothermofontia sp.]